MAGIRPVLARLGLEQYTDRFADEGFETWDTILNITESDLYADSCLAPNRSPLILLATFWE